MNRYICLSLAALLSSCLTNPTKAVTPPSSSSVTGGTSSIITASSSSIVMSSSIAPNSSFAPSSSFLSSSSQPITNSSVTSSSSSIDIPLSSSVMTYHPLNTLDSGSLGTEYSTLPSSLDLDESSVYTIAELKADPTLQSNIDVVLGTTNGSNGYTLYTPELAPIFTSNNFTVGESYLVNVTGMDITTEEEVNQVGNKAYALKLDLVEGTTFVVHSTNGINYILEVASMNADEVLFYTAYWSDGVMRKKLIRKRL